MCMTRQLIPEEQEQNNVNDDEYGDTELRFSRQPSPVHAVHAEGTGRELAWFCTQQLQRSTFFVIIHFIRTGTTSSVQRVTLSRAIYNIHTIFC